MLTTFISPKGIPDAPSIADKSRRHPPNMSTNPESNLTEIDQ